MILKRHSGQLFIQRKMVMLQQMFYRVERSSHTVFVADTGYKIESGRILSEDGLEMEVLSDCAGKEKYEYDVKLLDETMILEVVFAPKGMLNETEVGYQKALDFI